jgi:hypothetical protein
LSIRLLRDAASLTGQEGVLEMERWVSEPVQALNAERLARYLTGGE